MREYRDGDEHGILDLFRRVFPVERSLAHWRWKFRDNPAGREILVAVDRDGRIAGQFASLPNRGRVEARDRAISQLLDHMLDPPLRGTGAYALLARAFRERFLDRDPTGSWFGFNLEPVYRLQNRLFGMELLHEVGALRFDLARPEAAEGPAPLDPDGGRGRRAPRRLRERMVGVVRVERFPASVDRLWAICRDRWVAAIVRDSRYLNWRYADCPDVDYVLLLARHRLTRRPLGLAVVRLGWLHEAIAALVDWLVPGDAPGVWRALAAAAHAAARGAGFATMRAWVPATSPDHAELLALGYAPEATPFVVSAWDDGRPERPVAALRRGWHYAMGDTDIF